MMENNSNNDYKDLFDGSEEKIASRYDWLYGQMIEYLKMQDLQDKVYISEDILNHVIIDYFVDIKRLKEFHKQIKYTNTTKIYAYLAFWILKRKPFQLKETACDNVVFVNESFVAEFLRCFMFDNPSNVVILKEHEQIITEFLDTLIYYFKYRDFSAKGIEILLLAFNAGKGYQYSYDHRI